MLENNKVNIKVRLALLWVALMFLYIYNDILSIYQPGHVSDLSQGHIEGVEFTQLLLLGAAMLMVLPGLMVLLSVTLKAKANRLVNIIAGIFHLLVLIGTQFVGEGEAWLFWRLYELFQAAILVIIIFTAWKWPVLKSDK